MRRILRHIIFSELRRACFNGNWFYVAAFMSLCFIGFIFYFVASCMDPGFAEMSGDKSIMVTFEVRSLWMSLKY